MSIKRGRALAAFCPTKTTARNFGRRLIISLTRLTPALSSEPVTFLFPFHQGITFQMIVCSRGIPAVRMKLNVASAVGSSLFLLMKPDPRRLSDLLLDVIGPGFSKRNRARASMPPSRGSNWGTSPYPIFRNVSAYSVKDTMCGAASIPVQSNPHHERGRDHASIERGHLNRRSRSYGPAAGPSAACLT